MIVPYGMWRAVAGRRHSAGCESCLTVGVSDARRVKCFHGSSFTYSSFNVLIDPAGPASRPVLSMATLALTLYRPTTQMSTSHTSIRTRFQHALCIRHRPSVCLSVVCRLSNVRAPYSGD